VLNGYEAILALTKGWYDIVLMDVQMPKKDGYSASSEIRAMENEISKIPIIAITANALMGDKEKCLEAGMNDYIAKPVDPDELISKIDKWLQIKAIDVEENQEEIKKISSDYFDFEHFDKMSSGNTEFQKEILKTFFEDINKRCTKLQRLVLDGQIDKITLEAHSIKGASSSIGAKMVSAEAYAIELSAKHNDIESVRTRTTELIKIFKKTQEELAQFFNP
ncbi:MAG: response regulator, partial [Syntrophothermus sp.]